MNEDIAPRLPEEVTEAMNAALAELGDQADPFSEAASAQVLRRVEW